MGGTAMTAVTGTACIDFSEFMIRDITLQKVNAFILYTIYSTEGHCLANSILIYSILPLTKKTQTPNLEIYVVHFSLNRYIAIKAKQ